MEAISIEEASKKCKFNIANVYIPPNTYITIEEFKKLLTATNIIITGDLNAKNPIWKSPETNKMGNVIEQVMEECDLSVLNTRQPTYQKHMGGISALDVTIASKEIAIKCSWSVLNDTLGSDHFPTFTILNEAVASDALGPTKWLLEKADWTVYREECTKLLTENTMSEDIEIFLVKISPQLF